MKYLPEYLSELNLLLQFNISSSATGIKVHSDASEDMQHAAQRLFNKGLCTLPDGGYLTDEGRVVAENADKVVRILRSQK